ncbi:MAG TPA: hypothetical protein VI758_00250 [Bacteroidota bacterium]
MKMSNNGRSFVWMLGLILVLGSVAFVRATPRDSAHVSNVRFEMSGKQVVIHYDLMLSSDEGSTSGKRVIASTISQRASRDREDVDGLIASVARKDQNTTPTAERDIRVTVILRKESDPQFRYRPKRVTGDVGIVHSGGKDKRIVWDIAREFPDGIDGNDFYFIVEAEFASQGTSAMWWIGGGAAAVAGGIAAFLLSSGTKPNSQSPGSYPLPPGRPQ